MDDGGASLDVGDFDQGRPVVGARDLDNAAGSHGKGEALALQQCFQRYRSTHGNVSCWMRCPEDVMLQDLMRQDRNGT